MDKIKILKDAIVYSQLDEASGAYLDKDLTETELPITWYLQHDVELEDGITVKEILVQLSKYSQQLNFIFINELKGLQLENLSSLIQNANIPDSQLSLEVLCLLWACEVKPEGDEFPAINMYPLIMALEMSDDEDDEDEDAESLLHSIYDLSANQLLNTTIVLDDLLEFYANDDAEDADLVGITNWPLYDFIRALCNELVIYTYASGVFPNQQNGESIKLSVSELFEHIEELDQFFKNDKSTKK